MYVLTLESTLFKVMIAANQKLRYGQEIEVEFGPDIVHQIIEYHNYNSSMFDLKYKLNHLFYTLEKYPQPIQNNEVAILLYNYLIETDNQKILDLMLRVSHLVDEFYQL